VTGYAGPDFIPTPGTPDFGTGGRYFTLRLSSAGDRALFGLLGPGGQHIAVDATSVYTAGIGFGASDVPITPNAYQQTTTFGTCGGGAQLGIPCSHQYVCKMDVGGTKLAFCTYLSGSADAPAGVAPDANGNIWVVGETLFANYPVTSSALQPKNAATVPPYPVNPPTYPALYFAFPATGYISELSADGSQLLYSSYLGGTGNDQPSGIAVVGNNVTVSVLADSPDFPGLPAGPQQWCLPSRLHGMPVVVRLDAVTHGIAGETVIEGMPNGVAPLLAGTAVVSGAFVAPVVPASDAIGCMVDAADFTQAAAVAPGQLVTIFGTGIGPATPAGYDPNAPSLPFAVGGASVAVNGEPAPLLYAAAGQINFVMPNDIGASESVTVKVTGPDGVTAQRTMAATAISPGLFTLGVTDYPQCQGKGLLGSTSAAVFNQDGSLNSCSNPAAPGSLVSVLLNGTGVLAPAVTDTSNQGVQVEGVEPEAGQPVGVWRVRLRLDPYARAFAYTSLQVDGAPAREQNVAIWVGQ
jgi:uncharacterized protein (TIGR03437 family)